MKILEDVLQLIMPDHMIYGICLLSLSLFLGNYFKKRHDGTLNKFFERIVVGGLGILKLAIIAAIIITIAFVCDTEQEREDGIVLVFYYFGVAITGFAAGAIYRWRRQKEERR